MYTCMYIYIYIYISPRFKGSLAMMICTTGAASAQARTIQPERSTAWTSTAGVKRQRGQHLVLGRRSEAIWNITVNCSRGAFPLQPTLPYTNRSSCVLFSACSTSWAKLAVAVASRRQRRRHLWAPVSNIRNNLLARAGSSSYCARLLLCQGGRHEHQYSILHHIITYNNILRCSISDRAGPSMASSQKDYPIIVLALVQYIIMILNGLNSTHIHRIEVV